MASRTVSVWYDDEGDMLEVLWAFREGYFTPTDDDRIQRSPVEFELAPEESAT